MNKVTSREFAKSLTLSHKTTFVLDRSEYFSKSCEQPIEYDVLFRMKTPGIIPAAPITKSLWCCNLECMIEYMRIVYDIYPVKKLIRVIAGSKSLNSWMQKEQNIQQIMLALAHLGVPGSDSSDEDYSVMHGLTRAIESMCELSEAQAEALNDDGDIRNCGKIICMTFMKSENHVRMLEECVLDAITDHNKLAATQEGLLPIDNIELTLIHITPVGYKSQIAERPMKEISSLLSSEVLVAQSGNFLYKRLVAQVQKHYNLGSTTVTGIPMKEEQNASSSANYDVELLHPSSVHDEIFKTVENVEGLVIPSQEGLPTETVTLKWCTPKSNIIELHHCSGAHRITPVDVNSRPSSCLTNFLLGGRSVLLEQPRKTGVKVISHMLTSHGGEIFIHTIPTARSILEDPPSISEGCGGRVTDYRITDFGEFMKENRLAPATPSMLAEHEETAIVRAQNILERSTRFWPMIISETILFNMTTNMDPLVSLITKLDLSDDDVLECKKVIYRIVGMENNNEPLPVPGVGARGKGAKREEQYRQLWTEMEQLIRNYASESARHAAILECLLECKKPSEEVKSSPKKTPEKSVKEEKMETESNPPWKEFDKFQRITEMEKQEMVKGDKSTEATPSKRLKSEESFFKSGGQNLLTMWTNRIKTIHGKRHPEFVGRLESGGKVAELYEHMKKEEVAAPEAQMPSQGPRQPMPKQPTCRR